MFIAFCISLFVDQSDSNSQRWTIFNHFFDQSKPSAAIPQEWPKKVFLSVKYTYYDRVSKFIQRLLTNNK